MERHYGTSGIPVVECINERLGKWRIRWDVQPYTHDEGHEGSEEPVNGVSFVESEFVQKPLLDDVKSVIINSGVQASMDEIRTFAELLDGIDCSKLSFVRDMVTERIMRYDSSSAVNSFTLMGKEMWLPKETRVGLVNSINIEKAAGKTATVLWFGGVRYELPIELALQMLAALELYALECYNITQSHLAAIDTAQTMDELTSYDYTAGYPENLVFSV